MEATGKRDEALLVLVLVAGTAGDAVDGVGLVVLTGVETGTAVTIGLLGVDEATVEEKAAAEKGEDAEDALAVAVGAGGGLVAADWEVGDATLMHYQSSCSSMRELCK